MGDLNVPRSERENLKSLETILLNRRVERCIDERSPTSLRELRLESCGVFVGSRLRAFERALSAYAAAKAPGKLSRTERDAWRAASDLTSAVEQMKHRVAAEEKDDQFFHIDDEINSPMRFSSHLTVAVSYRWRTTPADEWRYNTITFAHDVENRFSLAKGRKSVMKQEEDRQEVLLHTWDHLKRSSLDSVREFFRAGGRGDEIPHTFRAVVNAYGDLDNFSTKFWPTGSKAAQ